MKHLYVTTDCFEAEELIEPCSEVGNNPIHEYEDMDINLGEQWRKKLGFSPMSSIAFNRNISDKKIDIIATNLVKKGLCVATEIDGIIKKYMPSDMGLREGAVKHAMQKANISYPYAYPIPALQPAYTLLRYSNNPEKVRDFYNIFEDEKTLHQQT